MYIYIYIFCVCIKVVNKYQKYRERLQKQAHERYQNVSEKEKDNAKKGPR